MAPKAKKDVLAEIWMRIGLDDDLRESFSTGQIFTPAGASLVFRKGLQCMVRFSVSPGIRGRDPRFS